MTEKAKTKGMSGFERYLTVWVGLSIVAGIVLGKLAPGGIGRPAVDRRHHHSDGWSQRRCPWKQPRPVAGGGACRPDPSTEI